MHEPVDRELTRTHGFLTRLARELVGDLHQAEDLVQDAWVRALRHDGAKSPGWFARVLRNLAINRGVSERRRRAREERAARPEGLPDLTGVEEELELGREVLAAARALPEPHRTAILLRYWRDLGPGEIARRLGVPLATVQARLARGRELLRQRLDRAHGDRNTWAALLLTAVGGRPAAAISAGAGTASAAWLALGSLGAAAVGFLVWSAVGRDPGGSPELSGEAAVASIAQRDPEPLSSVGEAEPSGERREREESVEEPPSSAAPADPLRGRVFDSAGRPLADVPVAFEPRRLFEPITGMATWTTIEVSLPREMRPRTRGFTDHLMKALAGKPREPEREEVTLPESFTTGSDADGRFVLDWEPGPGVVRARAADWVGVVSTWVVEPDPAPETTVVVARAGVVSGRIEDDHGRPVADADLCLLAPEGFWSRFEAIGRSSLELVWTRSGTDGSFAFADAPLIEGARVAAAKDGYLDAMQPVKRAEAPVIVRMRSAGTEVLWRGRVVDAAGRPVPGARVSFGGAATLSDANGEFALDARPDHPDMKHLRTAREAGLRLRALAPGHLPGVLELALDPETKEPAWPGYAVLRLGPAPLAFAGRVADETGAPVKNALVALEQATWFSGTFGGDCIESVLGGLQPRWPHVDADADGRFRLPGLQAREYRLVVTDPETLEQVVTEPLAAGDEDLRLVLDRRTSWRSVNGRLVSVHGEPLAGVRVSIANFGTDLMNEGVFVRSTRQRERATVTDALGRFELQSVPRKGCTLHVGGTGFVVRSFGEHDSFWDVTLDQLDGIELVARRLARVQVVLADPGEADGFELVDPEGRERARRERLTDGRSRTFELPEGPRILVLFREETEVRRTPVDVRAGERNELP